MTIYSLEKHYFQKKKFLKQKKEEDIFIAPEGLALLDWISKVLWCC